MSTDNDITITTTTPTYGDKSFVHTNFPDTFRDRPLTTTITETFNEGHAVYKLRAIGYVIENNPVDIVINKDGTNQMTIQLTTEAAITLARTILHNVNVVANMKPAGE